MHTDTNSSSLNHCSFPDLPLLIKAKVIFKSANATQIDSVVVFTFEVQKGFPIIVPIKQNQLVGWDTYFNLVTSIYPKEGYDPVDQWTNKGLLLWKSPDDD